MANRFRQGKYIRFFLICLAYMLIVYFPMYTHGLVNQWDGIWEYNYYKAGRWSISLGRWLWPFLDRMKMGLGMEPFATMVTCALFAFGITLAMFFIFDQKRISGSAYLCSFLFLGSASVCISLSYRFMSATYGFAFLFSILAVFLLAEIKKSIPAVFLAGLFIAAQMGLYQAYLGCTGVMIVIWLLTELVKEDRTLKSVAFLMGRAVCALAFGGALYLGGMKLCMKLTHTVAASYKGMENYTVMNMISNLGSSIGKAYEIFRRFYFNMDYHTMLFMNASYFYYGLMIMVTIAFVIRVLFCLIVLYKKDWKKGILATALLIVLPVASNAVILVATEADMALQMTVAQALFLPVIFCMFERIKSEYAKHSQPPKALKMAEVFSAAVLMVMLYGTVAQTQVDQEAMRTGMLCVTNMAKEMVQDLKEEGYLNCGKSICVVGVPSGNELYYFSQACEGANHYAVFGTWGVWSDRESWQGVFEHLICLNIEFATKEQYGQTKGNPEIADMPCFPNRGYIKEIGDVILLKVSEAY